MAALSIADYTTSARTGQSLVADLGSTIAHFVLPRQDLPMVFYTLMTAEP